MEKSVDSFINSEEKRLFRTEGNISKPQRLRKRRRKRNYFANRPRNQKSLADFSSTPNQLNNWWKPVLDGSITSSREDMAHASDAAKEAKHCTQPRKRKSLHNYVDHREGNSTLPAMLKLRGHEIKIRITTGRRHQNIPTVF